MIWYVFDAETTVGMVRPPPNGPQAVDVTQLSALQYVFTQMLVVKNYVTNIQSDKRFELVCISHKVLGRNRTVGREKEGSRVVIPTIYGNISWAVV